MEAWMLGQADALDYSQWGIIGALLVMSAGFIAYLKHRDSEDRKEREQLAEWNAGSHKACEETIKSIVDRHENSMMQSRNDFREMLKEVRKV